MADITKAVSANDIKNGTSVTGVDGTGNVQSYFEAGKDATSPSLSDIQNKYSARFDDINYYFFQEDSPLVVGLVAYYRMDEESGVRTDTVNGKNLTDNNTVGYTAGVSSGVSNAASFVRSNLEYLSLANSSLNGLSPGDADWSVAFWFKLDSSTFSNNQNLCGVWKTSPTNNREYMVFWKAGHTRILFYTSSDGIVSSSYLTSSTNSFVADTWYHLVICHDASNDQRLMYVDGALDNSDSYSDGVFQGDGELDIGRTESSTNYLGGGIDEWGLWSRVLPADEVSDLYNSGDGTRVK